MGTLPFKPTQIDIVSELNYLFAGTGLVVTSTTVPNASNKDYSSAMGLVLLSLFLHGAYLWTHGF
jgi:hypothetical protein